MFSIFLVSLMCICFIPFLCGNGVLEFSILFPGPHAGQEGWWNLEGRSRMFTTNKLTKWFCAAEGLKIEGAVSSTECVMLSNINNI